MGYTKMHKQLRTHKTLKQQLLMVFIRGELDLAVILEFDKGTN
jgi:hypothetical protein